ncbi:ATP-grasp domain-containing protein [Streptomyces acidicola]|uniref:ATP-grasp domain-containing protein n=1 Tax=Streptomyces acidicola TaxID=2596892 RepID=A0A5N8X0Z8_9ACTN|nr:ATP-grasp domain-containing protein [Streptomyces acidicola]MPY52972.1 ATP-grasp domain-containing protein [Streptomyces acidicola]
MHIVLVETTAVRGFDMVAEMADSGIEVSFVTGNLDAYRGKPGFELASRAARTVEVPLQARGGLADRLRGRLGPTPPDGVIGRDEVYPFAVAELARDLGLPHESLATARILGDKAAVRARLAQHRVGSLAWRVAGTEAEGMAAVDEIGLPVVVKPTAGGWSVGVTIAWTRAEAARALSEVLGVPAGRDGAPPRALVESYAVGRHVSAELLVQGERVVLLGFAERLPAPPGQAAELGGHFPARIEQEAAARSFVLDVVRALGIRSSAVHAELLLTPTGPELIEINARIAGHVVARQMSLALGRSLTRDLVTLAVGDPVQEAAPPETVVALHQLYSPVDAVVRGVKPVNALTPEVVETHLAVEPGDRVPALRTNHDRIGYVLARGRTGEAAARAAADAARHILTSLELQAQPAPRTPAAPAPDTVPCGDHLLVLLGADDPAERILAAVGAVTARLSVVWTGGPDGEDEARTLWRRHYRGQWRSASSGPDIRAAARLIHAAEPVHAALTLSPSPVARQLRDGAPAADRAAAPPRGHTVVVAAHRGTARALAVIDEEQDARLCPSGLSAPLSGLLAERAVRAVREARVEGVVRCVFPSDRSDACTPLLLPGLDAATIDLYEATHTRSLVCAVAETALGRTPRGTSRGTVAVQRDVPTPGGRFRVMEATTAEELSARPGLFRAQVFTRAGDVHEGPGPAVWLRHTVVAADHERARRAAARLEGSLVLRTASLDRTHVLLLDRLGPDTWTHPDGSSPVLPADRYRLSVLTSAAGSGPAELTARTDLGDDFALDGLARAVHAAHPVDRVAAMSERLLEPAARLRRLLGTPGEKAEEVRRFVDKAVMKRIARRHGIRCADGLLVHTPEDVTEMFDRYGKIVLKPRAASGSQGVAVVSAWPALQTWLREEFVPGTQLCEEFVDAPMCHIDAVVRDGEPVWDVSVYERDTMALRSGRPLSSATVADPGLRAAAGRLLAQVVDAWRMRSGVLHLEAFVTGEHLTFCEVAARPGGAGVTEAFRATNGIDLRHAKLLADVGEDPLLGRREPVAAHAGWTVHYCGGGRLLEYDDSAVAPYAHFRSVQARVGDTVPASSFSGTGVSTHVFVHDSHTELSRLLSLAERGIRVVTGPADEG